MTASISGAAVSVGEEQAHCQRADSFHLADAVVAGFSLARLHQVGECLAWANRCLNYGTRSDISEPLIAATQIPRRRTSLVSLSDVQTQLGFLRPTEWQQRCSALIQSVDRHFQYPKSTSATTCQRTSNPLRQHRHSASFSRHFRSALHTLTPLSDTLNTDADLATVYYLRHVKNTGIPLCQVTKIQDFPGFPTYVSRTFS